MVFRFIMEMYVNKIVLGLGSNLGDRLSYLRHAIYEIKKIPQNHVLRISPVYLSDAQIPKDAPDDWQLSYLNTNILCETNLTPEKFLAHTQAIEKKLGRVRDKKWGPRVIDIDILAYNDLIVDTDILKIPHPHLLTRPFALWPFADILPDWIHPEKNQTALQLAEQWDSSDHFFHAKKIAHRIDIPQLMGIVNLTPDSFSDGGKLSDVTHVLTHIHHLIDHGASIIDIGAEATNPNVSGISAAAEWSRLEPVLAEVLSKKSDFLLRPLISIDTRHTDVAKKALKLGVDWINDVSGLDNLEMRNIIADHSCDVVVMHHLGIPVDRTKTLPLDQNPIDLILQWGNQRILELEQQGISRNRIIFDPGIGFGKTAEQSFYIIQHISRLNELGVRVLVGHSRKRFLDLFTNKPFAERDVETTFISKQYLQKVDYLRVHNIAMHVTTFSS